MHLKNWRNVDFSACCRYLSLINLNSFIGTFSSISQEIIFKKSVSDFWTDVTLVFSLLQWFLLLSKTLLLSFVFYTFIALSFFSCKVVICNLWTETLQTLMELLYNKSLHKNEIKIKQCISLKPVCKTPNFGSTPGLLSFMYSTHKEKQWTATALIFQSSSPLCYYCHRHQTGASQGYFFFPPVQALLDFLTIINLLVCVGWGGHGGILLLLLTLQFLLTSSVCISH